MRNNFINSLVKKARVDESVILIVGDLGFNVIEPFQNEFPERFINAGISEQNMASMAAGLASEGYKVFIYSIGNFPTFRCAEQIRNDICYHNYDVTIVTVGGGLSYGNLGYSHHTIQDYGLMRLFPEMSILSPGDPNEVLSCMNFIFKDKFPKYLRLRKAGETNFTKSQNLRSGEIYPVALNDSENVFITTGNGLSIATNLIKNNIKYKDYSLYTLPIWGPKYSKDILGKISNFKKIITVEDHLKSAGFGSWIKESFNSQSVNFQINSYYIDDSVIGKVGSEEFLLNNLTNDFTDNRHSNI